MNWVIRSPSFPFKWGLPYSLLEYNQAVCVKQLNTTKLGIMILRCFCLQSHGFTICLVFMGSTLRFQNSILFKPSLIFMVRRLHIIEYYNYVIQQTKTVRLAAHHLPEDQALAIPAALEKRSLIINSETGSGKTAAFALPLLQRLAQEPTSIFAVIVAPSLELAMQIHQQMAVFGQSMNLRQALIVGGVNYRSQHDQLDNYPHVIVATPGRLAEMLQKSDKLVEEMKRVQVLVLDEADRLFQERILPSMQSIIRAMPVLNQVMLATATIDEQFEGKKLKRILNVDLDFQKFSTFSGKKTVRTLTQNYIFTSEQLKPGYLLQILKSYPSFRTIVFVKTCKQCTLICQTLQQLQLSVTQLHSFMKNHQRVANLATFRTGQAQILVTTDLTSRGLDISDVNLVLNYHFPRTVSDYIHRVGRTARNGLQGEAISLVTPNEVEALQTIEAQIGVELGPHDLNQKPDLELVSKFSRTKREVKIHLMSCGVLEELEKRRERKQHMKNSTQP